MAIPANGYAGRRASQVEPSMGVGDDLPPSAAFSVCERTPNEASVSRDRVPRMAMQVMEYRAGLRTGRENGRGRGCWAASDHDAHASDAGLGCGGLLMRPPLLAAPAY